MQQGPGGGAGECDRCHYQGLDLWVMPIEEDGTEPRFCWHCLRWLHDIRKAIESGAYTPELNTDILVDGLMKELSK